MFTAGSVASINMLPRVNAPLVHLVFCSKKAIFYLGNVLNVLHPLCIVRNRKIWGCFLMVLLLILLSLFSTQGIQNRYVTCWNGKQLHSFQKPTPTTHTRLSNVFDSYLVFCWDDAKFQAYTPFFSSEKQIVCRGDYDALVDSNITLVQKVILFFHHIFCNFLQ